MKRTIWIMVAVLVVALLAGCAAGGLLGLLKLIGVGRLVGQLSEAFSGDDPTEYRVYMDGYDIGRSPGPNGNIDLNGLPEGLHLISITTVNKQWGWHRLIEVSADQTVDIGQINPIQGATIAGTLSRETTGGGTSLLPGMLVMAVKNAATLLQPGGSGPIYLPPDSVGSGLTYLPAYTDDQGRFRLGPAEFGDYIVIAAAAGYLSDAAFVPVSAGQNASGINLVLARDGSQNPGRISGAVSVAATGKTLMTADMDPRVYQTPISSGLRQQIEQQSGLQLTTEPWFRLGTLTTLSDDLGTYNLDLPAGRHRLQAFMFGYQANEVLVDLGAGALETVDFTLQSR